MATAQVELNDQLQKGTSGTLTNQTFTDMLLIRSHSWDGSFPGLGSLPLNIPKNSVAHFTHLKGNQGSKAAVSYTINTANGQPGAVILAWNAPAYFDQSTSPNRVFAVVGPKAAIDNITLDQIEMQLDKSGSLVEVRDDGVAMYATILNNPIAKMADLLAKLSYLCPKP